MTERELDGGDRRGGSRALPPDLLADRLRRIVGGPGGQPTVLVLGDSTALGAERTHGTHILTRVTPTFVDTAACWLAPARVVLDAAPARTARSALRVLPALLAAHRPHAVTLPLGLHDLLHPSTTPERFTDALARLCDLAGSAGVPVVLCDLPPVTRPDLGPRVAAFNGALHDLATRRHLPVVRAFDVLTAKSPARTIGPDALHPTAFGHALLAAELLTALVHTFAPTASAAG